MARFNTMEETELDFPAACPDQIEDILTWEIQFTD
jgi:hypothetical protein